ncbi:MAG TPA: M42 family metallopeptidase [Thermoclostridium caenicola]|mgnify:FL=1|uniref:Endoglucanase n=1 Tax=Thermoclostridium caenicola TaxID=659425 RepID=A0A1M6DAW5_9FIRM|nr:M42 family metallopeptidase [Thermoclostridium caenicola]SHI70188.1 endoglucanase [Thermoclostridium caenicola]HOK43555.1 M42 family metallopeptidase [Thermoclostridium caenicola]HOL83748.1 M42 family metallopeptidase [Thermoclostridium caenicola]HOP72729.1 M42 family metallopeptidase [Thermoclostridium caenicola]HPO76701.1 M42 family metallopeptidase [Thermoclostridium caenicola]
MFDTIKKLVNAFGPSGCEKQVAEVITQMIKDKVDEIYTDAMGNLIAVKKGSGKKIMLAAHMDEIGLIVSYIDEKGFLRFGTVGGVSPLIALGQRVVFENGTTGVVWYEENLENMKDAKPDKMYIDIAAKSRDEAMKMVNVGDMAVFAGEPVEQNGRVISKALDDRVGCAILAELAMKRPETDNEIYYVFTTQEEVGLRGARTAAFGIMPDLALAIDVTRTGDTPSCTHRPVVLGEGPAVKVKDSSVIAHPRIRDRLVDCAKENGIPYQLEVLERGGTDAGSIHITAGGIPTGAVSIPSRFIHCPAEMIDLNDAENTVRLLEAFVKAR